MGIERWEKKQEIYKNQTDNLNENFNKGHKSGRKEDPNSASETMLIEKNGDYSEHFLDSETLTVQQNTSFFFHLWRKLKLDESSSDAVGEDTISNLTQQLTDFIVLYIVI